MAFFSSGVTAAYKTSAISMHYLSIWEKGRKLLS
jgi:hypothetical protein